MPESRVESAPSGAMCPVEDHIEAFLTHLRGRGYAERTLRKKRSITLAFARWAAERRIVVADLNESRIAAFLRRTPLRTRARVTFESGILCQFLDYVRMSAGIAPQVAHELSPGQSLELRYAQYLQDERGLSAHSLRVYVPFIHDFHRHAVDRTGSWCATQLDATTVRDFLLSRVTDPPNESSRLLATALRSFLRFLYTNEEITVDLSPAVPSVRKYRHAGLHGFFSPQQIEQVLCATDGSTPCGRRDHAILLLLARLGLRAGEVVKLELNDIHWRTGEILIRGKGRRSDRLPLPAEVGEALALYMRTDRWGAASPRVFLRMKAPQVGLTGPAAVGHVVRSALKRAALPRPCRGAAHLFRHSLATTMIRRGASIPEISEALRHSSPNSTEIYAKVAFEDLRGVARAWPGMGGAR